MKVLPLILGAIVLLLILLAGAYWSGVWIPNNPGIVEYPIRGVDVSGHQGRVNWNSVASSGIRFAYLKATEGGDFQDVEFAANLHDAREAGLPCGAYHFFSLRVPGIIQAQNFIKTVPRELVTLPPAIDLEYWGNSSVRPTPDEFQEQLRLFLDAIRQEYGREPVIYTSNDFSSYYLKNQSIRHPWVRAVLLGPGHDGADPWLFWQYTEKGRVPGINSFVDMDVFNGSPADFHLLTEGHKP